MGAIKDILNAPIPTLFELHETKELLCNFCQKMYTEAENKDHGLKIVVDKNTGKTNTVSFCQKTGDSDG